MNRTSDATPEPVYAGSGSGRSLNFSPRRHTNARSIPDPYDKRERFPPVTTLRVATRARYTTVDRRSINHDTLSFRARGVLVWLLDKPDGWHVNADRIAEHGKEGRDAIRAALTELEVAGYLVRNRSRGDGGRWTTEHVLYEHPSLVPDEPDTTTAENQRRSTSAGWPTSDNQAVTTEDCYEDCYEPSSSSDSDARPDRVEMDDDEIEKSETSKSRRLRVAHEVCHRIGDLNHDTAVAAGKVRNPKAHRAACRQAAQTDWLEDAQRIAHEHPNLDPAEIADRLTLPAAAAVPAAWDADWAVVIRDVHARGVQACRFRDHPELSPAGRFAAVDVKAEWWRPEPLVRQAFVSAHARYINSQTGVTQ